MKRTLIIAVSSLFIIVGGITLLNSRSVGTAVSNVTLKNGSATSQIPGFGTKVISITYASAGIISKPQDYCDPINTALKNKNFDKNKYQGIGVANMKDSGTVPDSSIEKAAAEKRAKYGAVVLTDDSRILAESWGLAKDLSGKSVLIIIGTDKKIKYIKTFSGKASQKDAEEVVALVEDLLK